MVQMSYFIKFGLNSAALHEKSSHFMKRLTRSLILELLGKTEKWPISLFYTMLSICLAAKKLYIVKTSFQGEWASSNRDCRLFLVFEFVPLTFVPLMAAILDFQFILQI